MGRDIRFKPNYSDMKKQLLFLLVLFFCFGQPNAQTFYMTAGQSGSDEGGTCIIPSGSDGNFLVAGYRDHNAIVLKMDPSGNFLWQREFDFSPPPVKDRIQDMILDGDFLVGTGVASGTLQENRAFVFKYDLVQEVMVWQWLATTEISRGAQIIKEPSSGDYLIAGSRYPNGATSVEGWLMEVDQVTGAPKSFNSSFGLPGLTNFSNTLIYGNHIYTAARFSNSQGAYDYRGSVAKLDLATKSEQWTYGYIRDYSDSAQLYAGDLVIENDTIFTVHHGSYDYANGPHSQLFLTASDLDGNLYWTRNYDIQGMMGDWSQELVATPDGFVILGNDRSSAGLGQDVFLMKVDRLGQFQWAKRYGDSTSVETMNLITASQLMVNDRHIFFVALVNAGSDEDMLIVKTDLNGEIGTQCPVSDLVVTSSTLLNVQDSTSLILGDSVPHAQTTPAVTSTTMPSNVVCATIVGVAPEMESNVLEAYPNPTHGLLNLRYQLPGGQGSVLQVHNMLGHLVSETILESGEGTLRMDLGSQSPGIYLLSIRSNGKTLMTKKVICR